MTTFYAYHADDENMSDTPMTVTTEEITPTISRVRVDGRDVGEVHCGTNGEWYFISPARAAEAFPIRHLDNAKGTGHYDPGDAICEWLDIHRT